MCGGGARSNLLLPLVVTMWGSVAMFVVYQLLLRIVGF